MKRKQLKDTNYLYISAKTATLENFLADGPSLEKLIEAADYSDCYRMLTELYSKHGDIAGNADNYEKTLSHELENTYTELAKAMEDTPYILYPFRVMYDCQNLKNSIKCELLGKDASDLLVSCGTVPKEQVPVCVNDRNFGLFTENLRTAAPLAIEELSASHDPQKSDAILDKAAFSDMLAIADSVGFDYEIKLCRAKADLSNIMIFERCKRSGADFGSFEKMAVPFAVITKETFEKCYPGGTGALMEELSGTPYYEIPEVRDSERFIRALEKKCDEIYLDIAKNAKFVPFGAEKPIYYLVRKENEIKNARIILSAKKAGLSEEAIRERVRRIR